MSFSTLLLFAALAHAKVAPASGWVQADEDKGLVIYERKEGDLLAFRTEGEVDASVLQVAGAILDFEHTTEWVEHLEVDKIIRRTGPGSYIEYTHVSTPFVLKDRDFLCEVNVKVNEKTKELVIASHSIEDEAVPPTKFVRGHVEHNEFRLSPAGPGKTKLRGEFHIDPKGSVPKWVVNLFQRAWPKKAFRAIQKRVASQKTQAPKELEAVLAPVALF